MKKLFQVGKLKEIESTPDVENGLVVAYRAGSKIHLQNLSYLPETDFKISYESNQLVIRIQLNDGEMLSISDAKGKADKETVEV
ncbi:hypothetical protein EBR03_04955 [bacterium]|nr:hypothetical protein [bacterium]